MYRRKRRATVLFGAIATLAILFGVVWAGRDQIRIWHLLRTHFNSLGKNSQGYDEYRHRQTGIVFVFLPGGRFLMGSPEEEEGFREEQPAHQVSLSPFLIAKYEVSQLEWKQVIGQSPMSSTSDELPVTYVSVEDCQRFCDIAKFSLPTEAQWEYACRGGTSTKFSFGDSITTAQVNFSPSYDNPAVTGQDRGNALAVDSLEPNGFGIHNMHGNVLEWCQDLYDEKFFSTPEASYRDPVSTSGSQHVARGGSWGDSSKICRSAFRLGIPSGPFSRSGFRPVFNFH